MMARVLLALGFVAMSGLSSAQAEEPGWLSSGWRAATAASHIWSDQSVNRDRAASGLNLSLAWPAGDAGGWREATPARALDRRDRMLSCYDAAQSWASDDFYGGTFTGIRGARELGSIVDRQYAKNRQWAQFGACTNANR